MSHDTPTIVANRRERLGSRYTQRLRKAGHLPAVIYGHKTDPLPISVDAREILEHLHHGIHVINVDVEGAASETCLVKDLQFGYLGDNVIHIDLARVDLEEEVEVSVHLTFVGEPEVAKKPGSIVTHDLTELAVRCKVRDIPDEIRVELTSMGTSLLVGDLTMPDGVAAATDASEVVCRVAAVQDDEEVGEAAEVDAGGASPEVIGEKDRAEGEGD